MRLLWPPWRAIGRREAILFCDGLLCFLLWPPRRAIGRREAILFCDGLLCFVFLSYFLFLIFLYLNAESPRPLGTASPNFQGSRMGGWNRPSLSPIFKFLSWRGAGVEKVPKNGPIFVGLLNFSSGRGAVYREYLLSCAESGKKLVSFYVRYPQPHRTVPGTLRHFGWG